MTNKEDNIIPLSEDIADALGGGAVDGQDGKGTQPMDAVDTYIPGNSLFGIAAGQWGKDGSTYPPNDPVVPLGYDGDDFYYLNARNGLSVFGPRDVLNKSRLKKLYGGRGRYLWWAYPRFKMIDARDGDGNVEKDEDGKKIKVALYEDNFEADAAENVLIERASKAGSFSERDHVRGRGAWADSEGRLVLHLGDAIRVDGDYHKSGLGIVDGMVYPSRPKTMRPAEKFQAACDVNGVGTHIYDILKTWNWARGDDDAWMMMGILSGAMVGGAMEHRPIALIAGDKGVGKTTLHELIGALLDGMLYKSEATTPAAIYQEMKQDTVPVALDETENDAEGKAKKLLEIARVAYSGGSLNRGGADGKTSQYILRFPMIITAINPPPADTQDRSRMFMPMLRGIKEKASEPFLKEVKLWKEWGRLLFRRMEVWFKGYRLTSLIQDYRTALIRFGGHNSRSADTFGTILACAHAAMYDPLCEFASEEHKVADPEILEYWGKKLNVRWLVEFTGEEDNWRDCLNHLLYATPHVLQRTDYLNLAGWIDQVKKYFDSSAMAGMAHKDVNRVIRQMGVSLVLPKGKAHEWGNLELFIIAKHPELSKIYHGSKWHAPTGVNGVWNYALQQAPNEYYRTGAGRVSNLSNGHGVYIRIGRLAEIALSEYDEDES